MQSEKGEKMRIHYYLGTKIETNGKDKAVRPQNGAQEVRVVHRTGKVGVTTRREQR